MTIDTMTMISAILARLEGMHDRVRILITIDGPCGGGKSTLAAHLSEILDAPIVHMDDFSIPHAQKTVERLAIPGGNLDLERFCAEVLTPWLHVGRATYRPYDCHADGFAPPVELPERRYTIFEGSYVSLPAISAHADLRIFLDVSPETQQMRLLQRVGEGRLQHFNARWIPLERAYFAAYGLPDRCCLYLRGDQETVV